MQQNNHNRDEDAYNLSFLMYAISNNIEGVKSTLDGGAKVDYALANGRTALIDAVDKGNAEMVGLLLERGAGINTCDSRGFSPLLIAALNNNTDILLFLLSKNADIELNNKLALAPLLIAATYGYADVVQILLSAGVKKEVFNKESKTPLLLALENNHYETAMVLLNAKANIDAVDTNGNTALHIIVDKNFNDLLSLIFKKTKCKIEARNKDRKTPFLLACAKGNLAAAKFLHAKGAKLDAVEKDGLDAFMLAAEASQVNIMAWLFELKKISLEKKNTPGNTALIIAAANEKIEAVKFLLEKGASIKATNKLGFTALEIVEYALNVAKNEAENSQIIYNLNKIIELLRAAETALVKKPTNNLIKEKENKAIKSILAPATLLVDVKKSLLEISLNIGEWSLTTKDNFYHYQLYNENQEQFNKFVAANNIPALAPNQFITYLFEHLQRYFIHDIMLNIENLSLDIRLTDTEKLREIKNAELLFKTNIARKLRESEKSTSISIPTVDPNVSDVAEMMKRHAEEVEKKKKKNQSKKDRLEKNPKLKMLESEQEEINYEEKSDINNSVFPIGLQSSIAFFKPTAKNIKEPEVIIDNSEQNPYKRIVQSLYVSIKKFYNTHDNKKLLECDACIWHLMVLCNTVAEYNDYLMTENSRKIISDKIKLNNQLIDQKEQMYRFINFLRHYSIDKTDLLNLIECINPSLDNFLQNKKGNLLALDLSNCVFYEKSLKDYQYSLEIFKEICIQKRKPAFIVGYNILGLNIVNFVDKLYFNLQLLIGLLDKSIANENEKTVLEPNIIAACKKIIDFTAVNYSYLTLWDREKISDIVKNNISLHWWVKECFALSKLADINTDTNYDKSVMNIHSITEQHIYELMSLAKDNFAQLSVIPTENLNSICGL
jgi:ankyrin repeat protein